VINIDIRNLITFRSIVEHNSYTKAALELQYSQSTITSHIKMLEEELGTPIFDRFGKKFVLNDVGKALYMYTLELLEVYDKIKNLPNNNGEIKGELKIGASETVTVYRLEPILKSFKKKYPKVKVSLVNDNCPVLRERLYSGSIDIAMTLEPEVHDENLVITSLMEEPIAFIASYDSNVEQISKSDPSIKEECIIFSERGCSLRKSFETYLKIVDITPYNTLEFSNMEAIKQCVASNLGISVVHVISANKMIEEGKIRVVTCEHSFEKQYIQMVHHKNKWISPAVSKFIEMTNANFEMLKCQ
jgi:DNA-binding transcriptional LysR family regulator